MKKDLAETCLRYLDGDLTNDELQAFGNLLVQSPEAADLLSQLALDEQHYRATPAESEDDLLPTLLKLEANAHAVTPYGMAVDDAGVLGKRSLASYGTIAALRDTGFWRYAAVSLLRSKPVQLAAVAAILALAVTLVFVFNGGNEDASSPMLGEDTGSDTYIEAPNTTVATLTASRNAQWAERVLPSGSDLYAGDRLTLTAGIAEITTRRGAVAILEAPATIEFSDNDNALRLQSGKLFGICETPSSKGLVVQTPHMDVTDLGTRFGVDADARETDVYVFEGAVTAIRPDASNGVAPTFISSGESATTSIDSDMIVHRAIDPTAFAALQPVPIPLPGTANSLAAGQPDPRWLVMTADGNPLDQPVAMTVGNPNAYYADRRDQSEGATGAWWLQHIPAMHPTEALPTVSHLVQTEFDLGPSLNPNTTRLVIACGADNLLKAIHINGNRVTELGTRVGRVHYLAIDQHLKRGRNTVAFELENRWQDPKVNPIGLYVRWHLLPEAAPSDALRGEAGMDTQWNEQQRTEPL